MLRVFWLIDSLTAGGAESLTAGLAVHHDRDSLDLHIGCLKRIGDNEFEQRIRDSGTPFKIFDIKNLRDFAAHNQLSQFVRELEPDIIHSHLTSSSIHGALLSRSIDIPLIASLHVMPESGFKFWRNKLRQRLELMLLNRYASQVVVVSTAARDAWLADSTLRPSKLRVVHNGIPVPSQCPDLRELMRKSLNIQAEDTVICCISVMRPGKGIDFLLHAFKSLRISKLKLLLIGDGPERPALEALAMECGIAEHIIWTGFRHDTLDLLVASDLFVLPSLFDAFPTVLIEAMLLGLPVIASDTGGIPEIVQHEQTGLLTEPGTSRAIKNAIIQLLGDPGLAQTLAARGQSWARNHLSLTAWQDRLLACYKDVLAKQESVCNSG